jgi:segregation and condensation protein B
MNEIKNIVEALVFASEFPLSLSQIAEIIEGVEKDQILTLIKELIAEYDTKNGGIHIVEVAGGYQFRTRSEAAPWIKKLAKGRIASMSTAAMETLAVVAYRQPVLKAEIDKIRGVDTGGALKHLIERKLVRILGRKDVPGKPIIYGTTKKFLEVFQLKDLSELPTLKEFSDLENK